MGKEISDRTDTVLEPWYNPISIDKGKVLLESPTETVSSAEIPRAQASRVLPWYLLVFQNLIIKPQSQLLIQLFRYGLVGGVAFAVDFLILISLTEYFGLRYTSSAAVAFIFGLITNYALSVRWVFNFHSIEDKRLEFLIFGLIGLFGLALTELVLLMGTEKFHLDYRISKIIAVILVFGWNFGARKYLLFTKKGQ